IRQTVATTPPGRLPSDRASACMRWSNWLRSDPSSGAGSPKALRARIPCRVCSGAKKSRSLSMPALALTGTFTRAQFERSSGGGWLTLVLPGCANRVGVEQLSPDGSAPNDNRHIVQQLAAAALDQGSPDERDPISC